MLRVHTLIDELRNCPPNNEEMRQDLKRIERGIERAVKFDLGDPGDVPLKENQVIAAPRFPFDNIYCELHDRGINVTIGFWCHKDPDGCTYVECFPRSTFNRNWIVHQGLKLKIDPGGLISIGAVEMKEVFRESCAILFQAIHIMNCSNVELVDNMPLRVPKATKGPRRKFYIYKTLHIKTNRVVNMQKGGGSHASPRVHLRRGHIRRLDENRTTWVQACVVGNRKKGIVEKDYVLDA